MNTEKVKCLPFIRRFFAEGLNDNERHVEIAKILRDYPIANREIWFYIISRRGYLTLDERSNILDYYQTYKQLWPNQETSVAVLLTHARINKLGNIDT